jgi:hypothetical protein
MPVLPRFEGEATWYPTEVPDNIPRAPYVDTAGVAVHYLECGPRDAEWTLVLLRGMGLTKAPGT